MRPWPMRLSPLTRPWLPSPNLFPPSPRPGVTIDKDGTIQSPAGAEPLGALADRVLKALIFGAEPGLQPLGGQGSPQGPPPGLPRPGSG
jgi:hypothetical protein